MTNFSYSPEIQRVIKRLGLTPIARENLAIGKLNTVDIFSNFSGEKFCLRMAREDNREWIKNYLQELHDAMGGQQYGLEVRYRTVEEQVLYMNRLSSLGANVPKAVAHGDNWILMSYLDGDPLNIILPSSSSEDTNTIITALMDAWIDVHSKGECLWDRCGKNELFSAPRTIGFIDFDVDVYFLGTTPFGIQASYDLAIGIRSYILQAQHRDVALNAIKGSLINGSARSIYHPRHLSEVLDMQLVHYAKLAISPEADFYAPQRIVDPYISDLSNWLKSINSPVYRFGNHGSQCTQ